MAESNGAVVEFDTADETLYDHSQPLGISSEFTGISVDHR